MIDECNNAHQNKYSIFQPGEGMSNATMVLMAIINPGTLPIVTSQITSTSRKWLWKGGVMRPGMGAQVNSIVHFIAGGRQDTDVLQNMRMYSLWMQLSEALNLQQLCPIYGAHNTLYTKDPYWLESKIPVTIFVTNNKNNDRIDIYQKTKNPLLATL